MFIVQPEAEFNPHANAYCTPGFVRGYLQSQGRVGNWIAATQAEQEEAIVQPEAEFNQATAYIEKRFGIKFLGIKKFGDYDTYTIQSNQISVRNNTNYIRPAFTTLSLVNSVIKPTDGDRITIGLIGFAPVQYTFGDVTDKATRTFADFASLVELINDDTKTHLVHATPAGSLAVLLEATAREGATEKDRIEQLSGESIVKIVFQDNDEPNAYWLLTEELEGYKDNLAQPLSFPRACLQDRDGTYIEGIPDKLKQCVAEYAVRYLAEDVNPDPCI